MFLHGTVREVAVTEMVKSSSNCKVHRAVNVIVLLTTRWNICFWTGFSFRHFSGATEQLSTCTHKSNILNIYRPSSSLLPQQKHFTLFGNGAMMKSEPTPAHQPGHILMVILYLWFCTLKRPLRTTHPWGHFFFVCNIYGNHLHCPPRLLVQVMHLSQTERQTIRAMVLNITWSLQTDSRGHFVSAV